MKLSKEQVKWIQLMYESGKTQTEISRIIGIPQSQVNYWVNEESRKKHIERSRNWWRKQSKEKKKEINQGQKEYRADYCRNRYKNDKKYREKTQKYQREYKSKKSQGIEIPKMVLRLLEDQDSRRLNP